MLTVIDTNVLLVSVSAKSQYHWLYNAIVSKKIQVAFTNEILLEYEEIFSSHWNEDAAKKTIRSLLELTNSQLTVAYFKLNLITSDADDNKFVDCAFASNADYIVTNDTDFNVLKQLPFPAIKVVSISEFKEILIRENIIQL